MNLLDIFKIDKGIRYEAKTYELRSIGNEIQPGAYLYFVPDPDKVLPEGAPTEFIAKTTEEFAQRAIAEGKKGVKIRIELKIET